jgi:hypothetical protein
MSSDMRPQADLSTHQVAEGHEESEVGIRGILTFGTALIVLAIVVQFVLGAFMRYFSRDEKELAKLRPARFAEERGQFPSPRLQSNPGLDTRAFVKDEYEDMRSYGWADRKAKVGKIPIERAMEVVLEHGLPVHKEGANKSSSANQ